MGVMAALLSACSGRSDETAVQAALQAAAEDGPEWIEGVVHFQDRRKTGTVIFGVLTVEADDGQARPAFEAVLERVVRAYRDQPRTRNASMLLEASTAAGERVKTLDVMDPSEGATVSTDDLAAHFGI